MNFITGMIGSVIKLWITVIVLLIIIAMLLACSPPSEPHTGAGGDDATGGVASTADSEDLSAAPPGRSALPRASLMSSEIPGITEIAIVQAAAPEVAVPEVAATMVAAPEPPAAVAPSPQLATPATAPPPEAPSATVAPVAAAPAEPSVDEEAPGPPVATQAPEPADEPPTCTGYRIEDLLFESASATLAFQASGSLAAVAELIPPDATVIVVGHTDSLPITIGNQALSEMRAQAVADALTASGVSQEQLDRVEGRGDTEPIASNDTPEGQRLNRRVEVFINCPDVPAN